MNQKVVTSNLKNPDQLDIGHLQALINYFEPFAKNDSNLASKAVRYIVDGSDEEVILELVGNNDFVNALGYGNGTNWAERHHLISLKTKVLAGYRQPSGGFWMRLAQILETAYRTNGTKPAQIPEGWSSWLAILIVEINAAYRSSTAWSKWSLADIEKILLSAGLKEDAFIPVLLDPKFDQQVRIHNIYYGSSFGNPVFLFLDIDDYLCRHIDAARKIFESGNAELQVHVLTLLKQANCKDTCKKMMAQLVQAGTSASKSVREGAAALMLDANLHGLPEYRPEIEKVLSTGSAGQRNEAVSLLWRLYGPAATDTLKSHAEKESAERVKQTITKLITASEIPTNQENIELPELKVELGLQPLDEEVKKGIIKFMKRGYDSLLKEHEKRVKELEAAPSNRKTFPPMELDDKVMGEFFDFVEGRSQNYTPKPQLQTIFHNSGQSHDWLSADKVKLVHVIRVNYALGLLWIHPEREHSPLSWYHIGILESYRSICQNSFGLRELDAVVASLPRSEPSLVTEEYLTNNNGWSTFCDWEADAIWPAFAQYPELLRKPFAPSDAAKYVIDTMRQNVFRVLGMYPQVPTEFVPLLWQLALGETKAERFAAQEALKTVPGKTATIVVALADGKQGVRAAAAEWLGRLGDQEAIEPLKKAFLKEKNEIAKGTMILALDALHANVDEFLNREQLLKEAVSGLAKKLPKGMEWVPLETLPQLHWQDNGQPVDRNIVKWWIVQSIQQKTPVCTPILRRYLKMCRSSDTTNLARYVLATFIGHDTQTLSAELLAEKVSNATETTWNAYASHHPDLYGSKDQIYRNYYNAYSNEFLQSAIEQKGMLAIVSAAGDNECVKASEKYIRKYYGTKLAQCKALVDVLAWIDVPLALQVLLSIANRFRTKSIRQLAEEHVQALADRQGWTIDELADRTIPDAGFERPKDEHGEVTGREAILMLDFGPRQFEVRLNDELEPVICPRGESKTLKALPAPGKDDDEEKAKEAKKAFSDAKKVVKEVVKRQAERLYEALCTQRSWRYEDWHRYLAEHPIVGRLCTHIVWTAFAPQRNSEDKPEFLFCFRPLEDGTLTNEADEEVLVPADAQIFVAHAVNTPDEMNAKWIQHYKDYDLEILFPQFGRVSYVLHEDKKKETELTDFEGHMINTFKLRSKATRLGYIRGQAEDGGCFYKYHKTFLSLHIQAIITFTGSFLPEQDIPAALHSLKFKPLQHGESYNTVTMPLHKVPPVLLSECYNDIKQIAAEGSGFDPDWQKKSYF